MREQQCELREFSVPWRKAKRTKQLTWCLCVPPPHPDTHGAGDADGVQPAGVQRVH